jgi:quinol monooxygenase YgiN
MAAGVVWIPWYATLFRGDKFAEALAEIAPVAMRYGATKYEVYRNRDDMYKFMQMATFKDKAGFEAYWYGEDFISWRSAYSGWYQVPILYTWADLIIEGGLHSEPTSVESDVAGGKLI